MKLSDFIPSADLLNLVKGVENSLLRRKRSQNISLVLAVSVAVLQLLLNAFLTKKFIPKDILTSFYQFGKFSSYLIKGDWSYAFQNFEPVYELAGLAIVIPALLFYLLIKRTQFLFRYSEEPFRYTFYIQQFEKVGNTPDIARFKLKGEDRFNLLHHDLAERLNERIQRFSILEEPSKSEGRDKESKKEGSELGRYSSHIHIAGHFVAREEKGGKWVLQVMPSIRIGPPGSPATLATPVKYPLTDFIQSGVPQPLPQGPGQTGAAAFQQTNKPSEEVLDYTLDADRYIQIVELVYSRIAHEIYRRIKLDLGDKVKLFPTAYLRAVALFYEAKDFERSNTIDAYDYALDLYREANRYFDTRLLGPLLNSCARIPLFWWLVRNSLVMESLTKIGYARCLIYRRAISALSGRYQNPLYVIPETIEKVILRLNLIHKRLVDRGLRIKKIPTGEPDSPEVEQVLRHNRVKHLLAFLTFRVDAPMRRLERLHARLCETLFEAYSVGALGYAYLGASQRATTYLENARAIAPRASEQNALWLLAAAECAFDIDNKLHWIDHAAEQDPEFEIILYRHAFLTDMRLRSRNELQKDRVLNVIQSYERVLKINPANIGALAASGYLYWLIEDRKGARQKYKEGLEVKSIVSQTFVGDLNYGLARVDAEDGRYEEAYRLFSQALSADPAVGG